MIKRKFLKNIANIKYFDLPPAKPKSKLAALVLGYSNNKIEDVNPFIYLCNKTTYYDKLLIAETLKCDYVFLKDEIVKRFYKKQLSEKDLVELINNFKKLKKLYVSVVIFPEKDISVFGDFGDICPELCKFLIDSTYNIRYLNLIGSYFIAPIWARSIRKGNCKFSQYLTLTNSKLSNLKTDEAIKLINDSMPSSASVYTFKSPTYIYSKKLANHLDSVVYCCPNCGKFFSIYAEYNCIKCKNCGSATEISNDGKILLSRNVKSFDDLKDFQIWNLTKQNYKNKPIIKYENIAICSKIKNRIKTTDFSDVSIYNSKIELESNNIIQTIWLKECDDIELLPNNTLMISNVNGKFTLLRGKNNQNLYIIIDLFNLISSNK